MNIILTFRFVSDLDARWLQTNAISRDSRYPSPHCLSESDGLGMLITIEDAGTALKEVKSILS